MPRFLSHPFRAFALVPAVLVVLGLPTLSSAETQTQAQSGAEADLPTLIADLQAGGYIIYLRHARTEADYADQVEAVIGDCSTQRMLSEAGWQQARSIGAAIAALNIPVGEVYSSEYCRAWQTADLAFGHYQTFAGLNFYPAADYTDAQYAIMRASAMPVMTQPIAPGTNRVIVGHDDVMQALTGIYPEPQGVAYVLQQDDAGGVTVVGHINPDGWPAP
jgi:phosphohistidine phosphatase SixA